MRKLRIAVIGAGAFGRNHLRVLRELPGADLVAVVDRDKTRSADAAREFECESLNDLSDLPGRADAAVVAIPTVAHAEAGCQLMESGIDVLIEKPIAPDLTETDRLIETARDTCRILQVGHLERFNPAVQALSSIVSTPLFFEIHRMSVFSPRSLDVDVVLDLMIHDIDVVLALTGKIPEEIRAAGVSILSERFDIANVRLAFPGGCIANLTASRVSTERVRKMRLFQPHQYISLDYQRRDVNVFSVSGEQQIGFDSLAVVNQEPLRLELEHFIESVQSRKRPLVDGEAGRRALQVALAVTSEMQKHARVVERTLATAAVAGPSNNS